MPQATALVHRSVPGYVVGKDVAVVVLPPKTRPPPRHQNSSSSCPHNIRYYVFLILSTVGYGGVAPITGLGRVFAILTIVFGLVLLIQLLSQSGGLAASGGLGRGRYDRFRGGVVGAIMGVFSSRCFLILMRRVM